MWYMKPVTVTIDVPHPTQEVFDFLDVMSNHERFTNHMLRDWEYSGPDRGIGSKARVTVKAGGRMLFSTKDFPGLTYSVLTFRRASHWCA